jgi:hypothetical protein
VCILLGISPASNFGIQYSTHGESLKSSIHQFFFAMVPDDEISVVNDPLGEPRHTLLYVGLLSAWGSMDGDLIFCPLFRRVPFWGLQQIYMNKQTSGSGNGVSIHRDPVREHGGGSLTGDSDGKMNFQGKGCRRFCRWVSLSIGVLLGNLRGGGPFTRSCER